MLTRRELERYSRQIVFSRIGNEGQRKLKGARVAILGLGAIGSSAAYYLTSAGIGYLRLIDRDLVELSNIQRQILYDEKDAEEYKPKAIAAKEKLQRMNSDVNIEAIIEDFNPLTAERLVEDVDLVLEGVDNMETRFLLNEVCVKYNKPFVHGAALRDHGVVGMIIPGETPCLKCIYPGVPRPGALPTCEIVGVVGPIPGIVGAIEAMEAIKYIAGFGELLKSKLLYIDGSTFDFDSIEFKRNPSCEACVEKNFPLLTKEIKQAAITTLCGRNAVQITPKKDLKLNLKRLAEELKRNPEFEIKKVTPYSLVLSYRKYPIIISPSGRALIKNTKSEKEAKSILNKIISF
jgi:adenylyltransferase/sulfurtransferase